MSGLAPRLLLGGLLLSAACHTAADDDSPWKLTLGQYRMSDGVNGQDLNLRWRQDDTNAWVGSYHDRRFGTQARSGFDTSLTLRDGVALQPSLQVATRGFIGGSINLQVGQTWTALLGWGRTNLKPYFNLNFDPNDAITLGAGWRGEGGRSLMLSVIADDRLHTGQRDTHLTTRWPVSEGQRLTLDLMRKTGEGDSGAVRVWGLTATLDFPGWFVRIARDPKQNFSDADATRIAAGLRF